MVAMPSSPKLSNSATVPVNSSSPPSPLVYVFSGRKPMPTRSVGGSPSTSSNDRSNSLPSRAKRAPWSPNSSTSASTTFMPWFPMNWPTNMFAG